ncbi:MAG: pyrroline-5-carboxylate reductase [Chitinophagaceae bacterium]|nr:pyrroline-5-carboxylate reductase [Bacteroidota bacterium]MCC6258229.1 pyrroline-5-carboxylate reductase [Chitinophagaceae bacterium]
MRISIIGGGNLGMSMAEGLLSSGFCKPENLCITRRNQVPLAPIAEKGVKVTSDNGLAVRNADVIILAVKPYQVKEVLDGFRNELTEKHILISVVTGILISDLLKMVPNSLPIFRAMPNTAIAIRESMTCIAYAHANEVQIELVTGLFNNLGKVAIINEGLMDAATVLGACGTAYAMRFIRANIQGGIEIGFDASTANLIAAQTVKGAAQMLLEKKTHPEQEIDKVTTPKGCTIAGLNEMEHQGFSSSLIKGIAASYKKITVG